MLEFDVNKRNKTFSKIRIGLGKCIFTLKYRKKNYKEIVGDAVMNL